ncbi:MAG: hypothetical protein EXQ86_11540 [Rhodospirillales bacterium]|nr:hypothetical protein [Rhodospirillales bacterium]
MRSSVLATAAAIAIFSGPAMAQESASTDSSLTLSTIGGAIVGGALVYYFSPLSPLTASALGAVVGGTIGNWWYSASDGGDSYLPAQPRKQSDSLPSTGSLHLIAYPESRSPAIRLAK